MDYSIEEKPLTVGLNTKGNQLRVNKTYFYQIGEDRIEPVEAREAWELHKKKVKQIGVSDGTTYNIALKEAQQLFKAEGQERAQERLREGVQEELEKARGNLETPPNFDIFGSGASYLKNGKMGF